jgi:predicted signal transduction protein with EAL and GGDEF domain
MAERVLSAFRKPWAIGGREVRSTASIGVAVFPEHGHDPRTLVKNADTAMYRVKNRGGNDYEQYAMQSSPMAALRDRSSRASARPPLHAAPGVLSQKLQ